MNTFLIIAIVVAAVYCFAAVGYYYAFKNWKPMCGSRKSAASSAKTIQWLLSKPEEGKDAERS